MLEKLFGGLGLFLIGMQLLTEGLKQAAGHSLKQALEFATQSKLRGLFCGTLITALVQSSSAVTVAALGFVNAGLLTLGQTLAVIYGCNIGTTMTGWLVALIGFKVDIGALALPLVGIGAVMKIVGKDNRLAHLGTALAGFGLFFIGLDFMRDSFDGLSAHIPLAQWAQSNWSLILFIIAGVVMTFLMQASAAVMAIALSLVHSDSIPMTAAAALVIGANIGTTTTAIMAAIGATSNAKRIAAAHVVFNLMTGAVGLLFLLLMASTLNSIDPQQHDLVIWLAVFHTAFNIVGVILIWPITDRLERFLMQHFQTQEENSAQPHFLDKNIVTTPALAVEALNHELVRLSELSTEVARQALSSELAPLSVLEQKAQAVSELAITIGEFNQELARQNLTSEISATLPISVRIARYYSEIARLGVIVAGHWQTLEKLRDGAGQHDLYKLEGKVIELLDMATMSESSDTSGHNSHKVMHKIDKRYQSLKGRLLEMIVRGEINADEGTIQLDTLSHLHRLAEQAERASSHWSSSLPIRHRSPLGEHEESA